MKITIIYDNTSFIEGIENDWGFSALIETEERKILFDTGANGAILLSNMKKLNIVPEEIEDIFISHSHFDHTGGLSAFLSVNNDVKIWTPPSFRGVRNVKEVIYVEKPLKLYNGIYSTGELEKIEQSMCIETKKGIVIITGCSHPSLSNILKTSSQFGKLYGIIGGMHDNRPEPLADLQLICPAHCTQYKEEIKSLYPSKYMEGGVGRVIKIE